MIVDTTIKPQSTPIIPVIMSEILKTTCLKFSLVATFLLLLQPTFAQRKKLVEESRLPIVDAVVEGNKKNLGNNFSVVVTVADSLVYQKNIGDVQAKTPAPIGAASQWLTTALIMQLVDEGKLSLDDKISQYLPVFESYRKGYITIRHCLTNLTGIASEGSKLVSLLEKKKFASLEEEAPAIAKKDIQTNAGEAFRYSYDGYVIVARIAEIVTKKRFDQVIRTRLFVPMGMRNTSFVTDDGSAPNPATGAKSTATDYARFLQMLLNNGKMGEKPILSEASVKEMQKVQVASEQIRDAPKAVQGYAFALGTWAADNAGTLVLPGWNGTWAAVNFNRGYGFVVLPQNVNAGQTAAPYTAIAEAIDQSVLVKK